MAESVLSCTEEVFQQCRETMKQNRQSRRENLINRRRCILGDTSLKHIGTVTSDKLKITIAKIKQKSQVDKTDFQILAYAFIQNEKHICDFVKNHDALHAVVRGLSGTKLCIQLASTDAVINLALGNDHCCLKVAKAASPYLIINAKSHSSELKESSIWALGNLLGSDMNTWKLVASQGVLSMLVDALADDQLCSISTYALVCYVNVGRESIKKEEYMLIASGLADLKSYSQEAMWLMFIVSTSDWFDETVIFKLLNACLKAIDEHVCGKSDISLVTAAVRCVANFVSETSGKCASTIIKHFDVISKAFDKMSYASINGGKAGASYTHLVYELAWLIGNLLNHPSKFVQLELELIENRINEMEAIFKVILNPDVSKEQSLEMDVRD